MIKQTVFSLLSIVAVASLPRQTAVPVSKEPRHHVKFENEKVRVIEAIIPPGDTTLFHTHSRDNVPVAISGGKLKIELLGRAPTFSTSETGAVSFAKATYTHRITNVGETTLHFMDAEIVASSGRSKDVPPLDMAHGMSPVMDNEQVRVSRLKLAPGESTGIHSHHLPRLMVVIVGGKVANEPGQGGTPVVEELKTGDFRWYEGREKHSLENAGKSRVELVNIEWK
jgi:quercetin dioxygenase-like cupin family protein